MSRNSAARTDLSDDGEVMAAISEQRLVIADISRDDAWLSVPLRQAVVLDENR
ncbi:hypothetical protein ACFPYI_08665 [Halomarina salina]|uniref:Uncharacterized protein n=1 Tax=Halomarina salina TaxID=1872699 RepID=A0ABD5RM23_9EURY|nr:hypothetical protein [Halomarina salina]